MMTENTCVYGTFPFCEQIPQEELLYDNIIIGKRRRSALKMHVSDKTMNVCEDFAAVTLSCYKTKYSVSSKICN